MTSRPLSVRVASLSVLALLVLVLGFAFGPHLAAAGPAPAAVAAVSTLTAQGSITGADRTQAGRIIRDWAPSACGAVKNVPETADTAARHYDAYTYANTSTSSQCVTVQLSSTCTGSNDVFSMAYLGSFNPASIKTTYRADLGLSPEILATRRDLEQLAEGRQDVAVLKGWRRGAIGNRMLEAL